MGKPRWSRLAAFFLLAASPVSAYYHYLHYLTRTGPYVAAPEKFDLAALPNKTVVFFVTDTGPTTYPANDSYSSVLSQIRQAAQAWNAVDTSDLRVAFGGLYNAATPLSSTPGGQVVFEDLPPGLLGYGGPTACTFASSGGSVTVPNAATCSNTTLSANGTFVPITRAVVHLATDLTKKSGTGPSYSESFFLTAVHEMGHALGLQHTFTSSAMSTAATRATSLSRPLDVDDIASLSTLYPAASFGAQTGVITGRITSSGRGVHMASVVAIRNGSGAVSSLTDPDGNYRIEGVPPGQYFVYAHPLPPQSNPACIDICPPLDPSGQAVAPGGPFNTTFYGGSAGVVGANTVSVGAGVSSDGVNIDVKARADVPIYGVTIYSFVDPTNAANVVSPGYLNTAAAGYGSVLAASALGSFPSTTRVQVMGGSASVYAVQPYSSNGYNYLNVGVDYSLGATPGPQHLIFTLNDFVYVLPGGLNLVQRKPPTVTSVTVNADGSVTITGANFAPDSAIYFDGLPCAIRSLDDVNGRAIVFPPPGASGQHATVSVYNHDGQNSLFLQSAAPVTFSYGASASPSLTLSPSSLPAGSEALIDITGTNTQFANGQMVAGFGSNDVFVRRVFVLSPTHLQVNVSIPAKALPATTEATAISGFQIASQPLAFNILPASQGVPNVVPVTQNAVNGQTGAYPGAYVTLPGSNLTAGSAAPSATLASQPINVVNASNTQITIQIPSNLPSGNAVLQVNNGQAASLPVVIGIDSPAPVVQSILTAANTSVDGSNPVHPGQVVDLLMSGFGDPSTVIYPSEVTISVGGVTHAAVDVSPASSGLTDVRFVLSPLVPTGQQDALTVYLDGRSSLASSINVVNQ